MKPTYNLREVLTALAEEMAPAWIMEALPPVIEHPNAFTRTGQLWPTFRQADGPGAFTVHLATSGGKHQLNISGEYGPRGYDHMPYQAERPSIYVSVTKAPRIIANDIRRRFLVPYLELLKVVMERRDAYERATNKALGQRNELLKLAGRWGRAPRDADGTTFSIYGDNGVHAEVQVGQETHTFQRLSLPHTLACAVMRTIARHIPATESA